MTDDHDAQQQVWDRLQPWDRKACTIRQMLANDDIPASVRRVRFVSLAAYESAGGLVRRDLFSDGDAGTYIADPAKLNRLASEKLQAIGETVRAEGWKWIELQPDINHQALTRYRRIYAPELPLSAEAESEIEELEEERGSLVDQLEQQDDNVEADDQPSYDQIDEIDRRIQVLRRSQKPNYSTEAKAQSGVVISIGQGGDAAFVYGLVRKEDERAFGPKDERAEDPLQTASESSPEQESPAYSAVLVETLTQHKTAAIAAELSQQPRIALATLVHALVLSEFGLDLQLYRSKSCLQVSTRTAHLQAANESPAFDLLEEQQCNWFGKLAAANDLWTWFLEQDQQTMLNLLAYCVARTVDGVRTKSDSEKGDGRFQHADLLATALGFDMAKWFTPTAQNFFSKVSKCRIADALAQAGKPLTPETLKFKKTDLASYAKGEIVGTGWLPEPLRTAS